MAKSNLESVKRVFADQKVAKQVLNAAKRVSKRPLGEGTLPEESTKRRKKWTQTEEPGGEDPAAIEKSLVLPSVVVAEEELTEIVLDTNRAPLVLAFAVTSLKYTMPRQPLSSRLSLAQAVVGANSRRKAVSLGIERGNSAEDEGWGQGQPVVRVMGNDIRVMKRWGYHCKQSPMAGDAGDARGQDARADDAGGPEDAENDVNPEEAKGEKAEGEDIPADENGKAEDAKAEYHFNEENTDAEDGTGEDQKGGDANSKVSKAEAFGGEDQKCGDAGSGQAFEGDDSKGEDSINGEGFMPKAENNIVEDQNRSDRAGNDQAFEGYNSKRDGTINGADFKAKAEHAAGADQKRSNINGQDVKGQDDIDADENPNSAKAEAEDTNPDSQKGKYGELDTQKRPGAGQKHSQPPPQQPYKSPTFFPRPAASASYQNQLMIPTSNDPALWALDLEALRNSSSSSSSSRSHCGQNPPQHLFSSNLPIHSPRSAHSYLMKSFTTPSSSSSSTTTNKLAVKKEKERNLALLLRALDLLYASWAPVLSAEELDRRSWGWYLAVRPDVRVGVDGWGQRGEVRLGGILKLRR